MDTNARMPHMMSTASRVVSLEPFQPAPAGGAVQSIEVQVIQADAQSLHLRYVLNAHLGRLRIPTLKPPARTDELWKHTCFEAFLRAREGTAYHELNASPSTEWALYSFDDYRNGMAPVTGAEPPRILIEPSAQRLIVDVQLSLKALPASRAVALAAVIEDDGGSLSYWALKHPAGRPDFHHADGFALEL